MTIGHIDTDQLNTVRRKAALRTSPTHDKAARELQQRAGGRWLCWYGQTTGRYWAARTVTGRPRLIEGQTPKDLLIAMGEIDAYHGALETNAGRHRGERP